MTFFGLDIGTFTFFTFSFLAGLYIASRAFADKETLFYRTACAALGVIYMAVTALAFMQLDGVKSHFGLSGELADTPGEASGRTSK